MVEKKMKYQKQFSEIIRITGVQDHTDLHGMLVFLRKGEDLAKSRDEKEERLTHLKREKMQMLIEKKEIEEAYNMILINARLIEQKRNQLFEKQ